MELFIDFAGGAGILSIKSSSVALNFSLSGKYIIYILYIHIIFMVTFPSLC